MKRNKSISNKLNLVLSIMGSVVLSVVINVYNIEAQSNQIIMPVIQKGHSGGINVVSINPSNNRFIATGGNDGTIKFWDRTRDGQLLLTIKAHHGSVNALVFTSDGKHVISAGDDATIRRWSTQTGRLEFSYVGHIQPIQCLALSPDGNFLVSGAGGYGNVEGRTDNTVRLWDVPSGKLLNVFRGHKGQIISIAFNHRGDRIATGSLDETVKIWDTTSSGEIVTIATEAIYSLAFNPTDKTLASAEFQQLHFWNARTGREESNFKYEKNTESIFFTSDWDLMFVGRRYGTQVWDLERRQMIRKLDNSAETSAFTVDGRYLASAGYNSLSVWDVNRNVKIAGFGASAMKPYSTKGLAVSGSGQKVAWSGPPPKSIGTAPGEGIYVIDTDKLEVAYALQTSDENEIKEIAFSPDETILASCGSSGVDLWSAGSGKFIRRTGTPRSDFVDCESVAFNSDGSLLAIAGTIIKRKANSVALDYETSYLGIQLFETKSWQLSRTLRLRILARNNSKALINSIAFSPKNKWLVSVDDFAGVTLWDTHSGSQKTVKAGEYPVNSVSFSPSGTNIVTGSSDEMVKIWKVSSNSLQVIKTLKGHGNSVSSVQYSRDGKSIISGSEDQSIRIWNIANGGSSVLEGHTGGITSIAINTDGRVIYSAGDDGLVNIWSSQANVLISSIFISPTEGGINFTPDGFYHELFNGGVGLIGWRRNDETLFEKSLQSQFNKPDVLLSRFRGTSTPLVKIGPSDEIPRPDKIPIGESEKVVRQQWQNHTFYALVIGNQNYDSLPDLENSVKDANEIADVLENKYNFRVTKIIDGTRAEIMSAFQKHERLVDSNSSFLTYYAGHGSALEGIETTFWQPVDADPMNRNNWISSDDIYKSFDLIKSRHILLISDSCFAGGLARSGNPPYTGNESPEVLLELMSRRSRTLMVSGGFEPVNDTGEGGHSVFAGALLLGLRKMPRNIFTADELYYNFIVTKEVQNRVRQIPDIRDILHTQTGSTANVLRGKFILVRTP